MPIKLENVGIAVRDLETAISFFTDLGLTLVGRDTVSGEWTDTAVGLDGNVINRECVQPVHTIGMDLLEQKELVAAIAQRFGGAIAVDVDQPGCVAYDNGHVVLGEFTERAAALAAKKAVLDA